MAYGAGTVPMTAVEPAPAVAANGGEPGPDGSIEVIYRLHGRPPFRFLLRITLGDRREAEEGFPRAASGRAWYGPGRGGTRRCDGKGTSGRRSRDQTPRSAAKAPAISRKPRGCARFVPRRRHWRRGRRAVGRVGPSGTVRGDGAPKEDPGGGAATAAPPPDGVR